MSNAVRTMAVRYGDLMVHLWNQEQKSNQDLLEYIWEITYYDPELYEILEEVMGFDIEERPSELCRRCFQRYNMVLEQ